MQTGKNAALERFMATVNKEPDAQLPGALASMVGNVTVQRGHVIVIGEASPDALEAILRRRKRGAPVE